MSPKERMFPFRIRRICRMPKPMVTGLVSRTRITSGLIVLVVLIGGCAADKYYRSQLPSTPNTRALIQTANTQLGIPYHAGGTTPNTGFDCSGFTSWVYQQLGVRLPRQSYDQFQVGQEVKGDRLRQGDLLFFEIGKRGASHVGIYVDHGRFIHCPSTGGVVREDQLGERYWHQHFLGARRILP
jgi:cell wall-associated NlpC family hydrolase